LFTLAEIRHYYSLSVSGKNRYILGSATLQYDTIAEFNVDSKAECDHLNNLAHETKTKKHQCPLSSVQIKDPWRLYGRNKKTMEERICERDEF